VREAIGSGEGSKSSSSSRRSGEGSKSSSLTITNSWWKIFFLAQLNKRIQMSFHFFFKVINYIYDKCAGTWFLRNAFLPLLVPHFMMYKI
jgi:hypothetical protein